MRLIQRGGPYPYHQDGVVYQNLERQLPSEPRGYYHEYTVVTPGSSDRDLRAFAVTLGVAIVSVLLRAPIASAVGVDLLGAATMPEATAPATRRR